MLFNSLEFLFLFLPIVLWGTLHVKRSHLLLWICVVSSIFYFFAGHAWFLLPMFFTTILDFYVGKKIEASSKPSTKRAYLVFSLTCNLGLLGFFKYLTFFLTSLNELLPHAFFSSSLLWAQDLGWVLPAGISFYTFQTMSYVIDVYRGTAHAESEFSRFLAFVTFFPHLVAGPLTRHNQLIPQLRKISQEGVNPQWTAGIFLFSIGLIKKVIIADRIANYIDPLIGQISMAGALVSWVSLVGYALQIYFDFSGYSDMAIGLGRLFQIELPINFNSPYQAKNPSDFWKRWHISLSLWLKDYLYISLGGNKGKSLFTYRNLMITMVLGGLWHGANLTFVCWGIYHGGLLCLYKLAGRTWDGIPLVVQKTLTCILIWLGWVFFRAETIHSALNWYQGLFFVNGIGVIPPLTVPFLMIPTGLAIALFFQNSNRFRFDSISSLGTILLGLLSAIGVLLVNYSSRFLYFQF